MLNNASSVQSEILLTIATLQMVKQFKLLSQIFGWARLMVEGNIALMNKILKKSVTNQMLLIMKMQLKFSLLPI